jgi:hypothetical protein
MAFLSNSDRAELIPSDQNQDLIPENLQESLFFKVSSLYKSRIKVADRFLSADNDADPPEDNLR